VVRQVTEEERQLLRTSAAHYAEKAQRYAAELRVAAGA
jgi:carbonic anhydrase/acetyltransferase-like protein (isoleucine patch superfamily)